MREKQQEQPLNLSSGSATDVRALLACVSVFTQVEDGVLDLSRNYASPLGAFSGHTLAKESGGDLMKRPAAGAVSNKLFC